MLGWLPPSSPALPSAGIPPYPSVSLTYPSPLALSGSTLVALYAIGTAASRENAEIDPRTLPGVADARTPFKKIEDAVAEEMAAEEIDDVNALFSVLVPASPRSGVRPRSPVMSIMSPVRPRSPEVRFGL